MQNINKRSEYLFEHMGGKQMNNRTLTCDTLITKILIFAITVILTFCIILLIWNPEGVTANAKDNNRIKTVTSIQIRKGDSLWSIAGEYITEEYSDRNDLIEEIKRCNGISSDTIHEDRYLLVPHYKSL